MSSSQDLVTVLKAELRRAGVTYADLARELQLAESSVKRIFAKGDLPLSRIDQVLQVLVQVQAEIAAGALVTIDVKRQRLRLLPLGI